MFLASTIYGISAIIVGVFLALNFDQAVENAKQSHAAVAHFSDNARSALLVFICLGFIMIPLLNTLCAFKTIAKVYRSTKKLFNK